ncbi:DUF1405 domain-containing protein [Candidatus Micrarchaeota archaeon]|nr:DUF1405 domain-containing protein [Candidatus Micrarchaeota archaeon]MBD3417724.1 DUF1405 domain-containing protein [Candidatus Micrarchaeota archaeon]
MTIVKVLFVVFCFVSFFFGYLSYKDMFGSFGAEAWVFIPDCPLYVALLLLVVLFDIKNDGFRFLVGAGLIKYGIWTLMIFALYPEYYFSSPYAAQTTILVLGHALMVLSSLILVPKKVDARLVLLVVCWFLLNDFMDYWAGTAPLFPDGHMDFVVPATIALSALSVFALYELRHLRDLGIMEWLRMQLGVSK